MGKCKDCKWWFELSEEGQCRRRAPKMIVAGCGIGEIPEYSNDWATIGKEDWCGEFEVKAKECEHEWINTDNKFVAGAEVCLKCKTTRAKGDKLSFDELSNHLEDFVRKSLKGFSCLQKERNNKVLDISPIPPRVVKKPSRRR